MPRRGPAGARLGAALLLVGTLLAPFSPARGSDTGLSGAEGHPRERFPLTVHAAALPDPGLDAALRRAVTDWNALFQSALGAPAFTWAEREADAQVVVRLQPGSGRLMGEAQMGVGAAGVVDLPVRVVVFEPTARGQTVPEIVLYQVVAHELGHALGLAHTGDPRSIMCCVPGSVDFKDPAARDAYVAARRQPDLSSVRVQLIEHYGRFWAGPR